MNTIDKNSDMPPLKFLIDGEEFSTTQQYITGRELKDKKNIPYSTTLYLAISRPYEDELIENDSRVNLARPDIEQFFVKKKLEYSINGKDFISYKQFITGNEIRKTGNVPDNHLIYLDNPDDWDDILIGNNDFVDLAREGKEKFISKPKEKNYIIVNGTNHFWDKEYISFEEVISLSGHIMSNPNTAFTVAFENGPLSNPEGVLTNGKSVQVKHKMIFYVTATDKS
ncbi:multiubiquitin [Chryseobacterium sp. 7]|uniref:multiubiquitin domain-containing protein n=1 Tax=Chryseobacterium sp. 7 TaxID=2035214 RepID=UPI000EB56FD3|nr:multiubiquitin domain-containing protein [Chryseobacterium sp. 7]RLJ31175.1 multiubiquitin [Chryseobacterium sp. 7]